ncbi:MAG: hypothetical protein V3V99_04230 [candidate division Zixibacteria bacterium]
MDEMAGTHYPASAGQWATSPYWMGKKTMKKCKKKTKKSRPCKKPAMIDSEYCYIHSIGTFKGVPWYKNGTWHFVIGILITLVIFAYNYYTGPTKEKQDKALSLLRKMERIDRISYSSLIAKYPEGYILFASDHVRLVIPKESHLSSEFEFHWDKAKILEISASGIKIRLPDINYRPYNIRASNVVVTLKRYASPARYLYPIGISSYGKVYIEILSDDADGIIYAIGFIKKVGGPPF